MEVQCPGCLTRFRVDDSLLGPNGRRVRCSRCGERFRVGAGSGEEGPNDANPGLALPPEAEDAPEPGTRRGPGHIGPDEPLPGPAGGPDVPLREPEEAPEEWGGAASGEGPGTSGPPARKRGRGLSWLVGLLVFLLVTGLLVELGYAFRSQLLGHPGFRWAVRNGLDLAGLDWPLPLSLRHYRAENVEARRVSLASGRWITLVNGVLVNGARFAQPPPRLELRVESSGGAVRYRQVHRPGARLDLDQPLPMAEIQRRWRSALREFPDRLQPGERIPFSVLAQDAPPGIERFHIEMVE